MMDEVERTSHKLELGGETGQSDAEVANPGFGNLDDHLAALQNLIAEVRWPAGIQGEFLELIARDALEFALAIRSEAGAGRWTAAVSNQRSLHERCDYLLAAAIDPGFWDAYRKRMEKRIAKGFRGKQRVLSHDARQIINRWEQGQTGTSGLLELGRGLSATSAELQHHVIGVSWNASQDEEFRQRVLFGIRQTIRGAGASLLLALDILDQNGTDEWRRLQTLVFDSTSSAAPTTNEPQGQDTA
jgi:hypothetical protein